MRETLQRLREQSHSALRVLLVVWLVGMLATAPAVAQTDTATATPTPEGETAPCATGPPVPGQDNATDDSGSDLEVALVNDESGSMEEGSRMADLRDAAVGFVERLEAQDEAAAVSFGDTATLDQQLTTDHAAVIDEIKALQADAAAGTNIEDGITTAQTELTTGTNASEDATKAMVLMTDADQLTQQQRDDAIAAAEDARANGIAIFAIGLGEGVDEQFLADVAGDQSRVYVAPDSSDLSGIYEDVSEDVEAIGGELEVDTRSLYQPGETHPYEVTELTYLSDNTTERADVTENASVSTTNTSILSVNDADNTLSAFNDSTTATWVRVDANHNGTTGCTNVIVAEATVENLELLPNGTWRVNAILGDSYFQALLVALFVGVAATRYSGAFAGLGGAQMTLTIGWFAGYVPWAFAALGMFLALFIGLNLAENVDIQVRR